MQKNFTATVETWLDADGDPVVNEMSGSVRPLFDGATRIYEYTSRVGEHRSDGFMIAGTDIRTNAPSLTWVDTFHTGGNVMNFAGDGDSLRGSYAAGDQVWSWRVRFTDEGIEHFNIMPDGTEMKAIRVRFSDRS